MFTVVEYRYWISFVVMVSGMFMWVSPIVFAYFVKFLVVYTYLILYIH